MYFKLTRTFIHAFGYISPKRVTYKCENYFLKEEEQLARDLWSEQEVKFSFIIIFLS